MPFAVKWSSPPEMIQSQKVEKGEMSVSPGAGLALPSWVGWGSLPWGLRPEKKKGGRCEP